MTHKAAGGGRKDDCLPRVVQTEADYSHLASLVLDSDLLKKYLATSAGIETSGQICFLSGMFVWFGVVLSELSCTPLILHSNLISDCFCCAEAIKDVRYEVNGSLSESQAKSLLSYNREPSYFEIPTKEALPRLVKKPDPQVDEVPTKDTPILPERVPSTPTPAMVQSHASFTIEFDDCTPGKMKIKDHITKFSFRQPRKLNLMDSVTTPSEVISAENKVADWLVQSNASMMRRKSHAEDMYSTNSDPSFLKTANGKYISKDGNIQCNMVWYNNVHLLSDFLFFFINSKSPWGWHAQWFRESHSQWKLFSFIRAWKFLRVITICESIPATTFHFLRLGAPVIHSARVPVPTHSRQWWATQGLRHWVFWR